MPLAQWQVWVETQVCLHTAGRRWVRRAPPCGFRRAKWATCRDVIIGTLTVHVDGFMQKVYLQQTSTETVDFAVEYLVQPKYALAMETVPVEHASNMSNWIHHMKYMPLYVDSLLNFPRQR